MFKFRAISFPLLLAGFALVVCWETGGPWLFAALSGIVMFGAAWDLGGMLDRAGIPVFRKVTAASVALLFWAVTFGMWWPPARGIVVGVLLLSLPALWGTMLARIDRIAMLRRFLASVGLFLWISLPYLLAVAVYSIEITGRNPATGELVVVQRGSLLFCFMVLTTKAMDTGGYIFGMLSGRFLPGGNHKIVPSISPKKSWEGTAGGILLSVLTALTFYWCGGAPLHWGAGACIVGGVVLALGSFAGDLTESAVKRACGVKDSANYIPGMGGAFDVLDSFLYNGLLFLVLFAVFSKAGA